MMSDGECPLGFSERGPATPYPPSAPGGMCERGQPSRVRVVRTRNGRAASDGRAAFMMQGRGIR